jgi:hypothetical protein
MLWRRAAEEGLPYRNNQNVLAAEEAVQLVAENIGVASQKPVRYVPEGTG